MPGADDSKLKQFHPSHEKESRYRRTQSVLGNSARDKAAEPHSGKRSQRSTWTTAWRNRAGLVEAAIGYAVVRNRGELSLLVGPAYAPAQLGTQGAMV
jgi:hypothetical protein